jgi:hypothetical protein
MMSLTHTRILFIRLLPPRSLFILVFAPAIPQAQALKRLRSLKEGVLSVTRHQGVVESAKSWFCGVWQDYHPANEIVADITTHRSGFGGSCVPAVQVAEIG